MLRKFLHWLGLGPKHVRIKNVVFDMNETRAESKSNPTIGD